VDVPGTAFCVETAEYEEKQSRCPAQNRRLARHALRRVNPSGFAAGPPTATFEIAPTPTAFREHSW